MKEATWFKNPSKPSSIDILVTNSQSSVKQKAAFSGGLSDFHKLVISVLNTTI